MSTNFIKQMVALFLASLVILFTVMAINEQTTFYMLFAMASGLVSYLLHKKKI